MGKGLMRLHRMRIERMQRGSPARLIKDVNRKTTESEVTVSEPRKQDWPGMQEVEYVTVSALEIPSRSS